MSKETPNLFGKTKFLEGQIDEFLDKVAEGAIHFERGITLLLEEGKMAEGSERKLEQILALKEQCKELRRAIVNTLYSEMLIPDFRGDVLRLLTDVYSLLDAIGNNFQELMIEYSEENDKDKIDDQKKFLDLVQVVVKSVDTVIVAARTFFRDPQAVKDYVSQVRVHESEADAITVNLKKTIFASDLKFARKINLRDMLNAINALISTTSLF